MLRVNLNCYGSYTTDSIYQWDQNHVLTLTGDNIDDISAIHYCNKKCDNARVVNVTRGSGEISAPIPNELLEMPYDVIAYVHSIDNNQGKTIEIINIPVIKRVKPDEYEFVENVDIANFERLEKDINDFISSITIQQNTFESDFMTEYNNRVASGYFIGPDGARGLNERIDQLESDTDARLDRLEQQIIDVDALNDASGSPILLTDTAEGVLTDIKVYGRSTQDGSPTPDNPIDIVSVGNGFDGELRNGYYKNETGEIVNGGSSGYVCSKNPIPCKANDVITVNYQLKANFMSIIYYDENMTRLSHSYKESTGEISSTVPNNAKWLNFSIKDVTNAVTPLNAKNIRVLINDTYNLTVKSWNKNVLMPTFISQTKYGVTFTMNSDDGSVTVNGTATENIGFVIGCLHSAVIGEKLIMSGCPSGGSLSTYCLQYTNNIDRAYTDSGAGVLIGELDYQTYSNCSVIINIRAGVTVNNITFYPMIRRTDSDNTYEPYKESVTTIPLSEPLRSNYDGSVTDIVRVTEGKIERKFIEVIFDGSDDELWYYNNEFNYAYITNNSVNENIKIFSFCSHYAKMTSVTMADYCMSATGNNINLKNKDLTDVNAWRSWLQANPITVVYELAEPVIEDIDPVEVVTYENVSYFTATDNAPMWVEYYSNSPIGKRLSNTNEEMKNEHDAIKATLGYMTTEKNHIKQCLFNYDTNYAGIDVTVNEDNSFTLNGTASQDINYNQLPGYLESGATYILSGCPVGGGEDSYYLQASYRTDSGVAYANDFGEGVEFTNGEAVDLSLLLFIKAGTTFENVTFYPMLRYATIKDDSYEPYGLNVKHRLEELDRKNQVMNLPRLSIDPSSTGENVLTRSYPDGFTRDNCMIVGVTYGYRFGGYGNEAPSKYYNDAVVVMTADNLEIHVNGNGSSSFVDVKLLLTKIN